MRLTAALPSLPNPVRTAADRVQSGVEWIDDYTSPRPDTHGNLEEPSIFQAAFNGATDGFYVFGPAGILTGSFSAALGVIVQRNTGKQCLGVLAGTVTGAVTGAAVASMVGGPAGLVLGAVNGGLMGAFETMRGHSESKSRDCGNASMLSSFFLHGPAKMAAGLGAMAGAHMENPWAKAAVGGAIGAAAGAGLAAVGLSPVGLVTAAVVSGAAGAIGPFFGPRFSQFFRNLAEDVGNGMVWVGKKVGLVDGDVDEQGRLLAGSIPASYIKEGLRAFLYSDGSLNALIVGGVKESIRQIHIVLCTRHEKDTGRGS